MTRNYRIAEGVFIDLDQIRRADFGDDGMIVITWQDGSTEKFDPGQRWADKPELKKSMAEHVRDSLWAKLRNRNPQLLPAAPGFELIHFDTGWMFGRVNTKDADPATFDIVAGIVRESVIAWEVEQPEPNNFPRGNPHYCQAIGCGRLRQDNMDDQCGPHWTALILPNGTLCADVRMHGYFSCDEDGNPTIPHEHSDDHTILGYFESIPKWIEYIRHDWAEYKKWSVAVDLKWKAEAEATPAAAE